MKRSGNLSIGSREAISLFCFLLSLFLWAAFFTFDASAPSHNLCGRLGGLLAFFFLNGLGACAFFFPLFFIALGVASYQWEWKQWPTSFWLRFSGFLILLISSSIFLALQAQSWNYGGDSFLPGGAFGAWIAKAMIPELNTFGASLVVFFVWVWAVSWVTPFPLVSWILKSANQGLKEIYVFCIQKLKPGLHKGIWGRFWKWGKWKKALFSQKPKFLSFDFLKLKRPLLNAKRRETTGGSVAPSASPSLAPPSPAFKQGEVPLFSEVPSPLLVGTTGVKESSPPFEIIPREKQKTIQEANPPNLRKKGGQWKLPVVEFLKTPPLIESTVDRSRLVANSQILKQKFADFGIEGEVTAVRPGPVITLYEFKPGPGVKVSRIAALADDLSMALSAESVRILAPLPGKSVVGIEIPSETREMVYLREFLQHPDFYGPKYSIPVVMGKDIGGQPYLSDLSRMPHLLCAGQTGSGKSVFMTGLICSLFYRFTPDELRMILVDPKFIEFRAYQDLPHLLLPVVDDAKQASIALKWAVREMERRYRILAKVGARNLASFHQKIDEMGTDVVRDLLFSEESASSDHPSSAQVSGGDWIEAFEPDETGAPRVGKLPYIVIIIDELADLMMIAKKEVEISIARIAQKARAAGIHLVIATQRPSTDVITGLIKANLPSRVSFQLASYIDSKTILDRAGAERLLGQGDMLFIPPGVSQNLRLHGAYVDDDEIHKITQFLKSQGKPHYRDEILLTDEDEEESGEDEESQDEFFTEAIELIKRSRHASASALQRHFKIGYNRAARMIELMEQRGVVGPQDGARPREILIR